MKWYWYIVIYILIVIIINSFIKHLAVKNNCYNIMNSISDNESKTEQRLVMILIVVVLTVFLDYINAFESFTITIVYFCFLFILAGVLPTLVKYIMALDKKKRNEYVDTSVTGAEKDLKDAKNSNNGYFTIGILSFFYYLFNGKKRK